MYPYMSKAGQMIKRFLDIVLTIFFFPLVIVITLVTSIFIRTLSGSPVFFCQERAGWQMKPFILYKFRTMKTDIDPFGPSPKTGVDPRLTRLGRWLRALSLDELPQFLNVLKGDMSLVGPRPLYVDQAKQWNERQRRRLNVKPGLTGLAQISGRGSLTIEDKLELDVQYAEQQSLWLDTRIVFLTAIHLVWPKGIYEKRYSENEKTRQSTGE